jgi:hypothetical protein
MSFLSNIIKQVAPVVATVAPFVPGGQAVAAVASAKVAADRRAAIKYQQALQAQEMETGMDFGMGPSRPTFVDPYASQLRVNAPSTADSGFFSTVRSGLREVGGFVSDAFSSGIPQLFGVNRPRGVGQQPAITTTTNVGAQESQGSGAQTAGIGSLLPGLMQGGRALLKSPMGQLALGGGAGLALSGGGMQSSGMRITRKMKSQARMVLNLAQGNISVAADMLNISEDMLVMILLKRFRNDGPVVTKAALRKTKQTVRRLKSMCDMYDSLRPAATRRRTPMKRASSTTLIKN